MLVGGRSTTGPAGASRARARGRGGPRGTRVANNDARGGITPQTRFIESHTNGLSNAPRGRGNLRGIRGPSQASRVSRNAGPSTRGSPLARTVSSPSHPNNATKGGDATAYGQRYQLLKKRREEERTAAIRNGFLADPDRPRTLAEAITPVGTCQDMCAEFERVERVVQNDVWGSEVDPQAISNGPGIKMLPDEARMVKKFRRAAAGIDEQLPSDLRPPLVLQKTIDYLFNIVIGEASTLGSVHHFVWDRTRAIRNDFSIQQISRVPELNVAIASYERIARFHILSLHQLALAEKPYEKYDSQQEREQLDKTLLSLMQYYDDSRGLVQSPNEAEFRAYCIIFQIQDPVPNLEDRVQTWPEEILKDGRVQRALQLYKAAGNTTDPQGPFRPRVPHAVAQANWRRFWLLVLSNEISYLMACVAEIYFGLVRRTALKSIWQAVRKGTKNEDWTLHELMEVFGYEDEGEVQQFCEDYGFTIAESAEGVAVLDLNSVKGETLPDPSSGAARQRKSELVERKRHYRTLPAVINGMSVRAAREAGFTEQPPREDVMEQDIEDEDSLFLPSDDKAQAAKPLSVPTRRFSNPDANLSSQNPLAAMSAPVVFEATPISNLGQGSGQSVFAAGGVSTFSGFGKPATGISASPFQSLSGSSNFSGFGKNNSGSSTSPFQAAPAMSDSAGPDKQIIAKSTNPFAAPASITTAAPISFSNPFSGPNTNSTTPSLNTTPFSGVFAQPAVFGIPNAAPPSLGATAANPTPQSAVFNFGNTFKPAPVDNTQSNPFSASTTPIAAVPPRDKAAVFKKAAFEFQPSSLSTITSSVVASAPLPNPLQLSASSPFNFTPSTNVLLGPSFSNGVLTSSQPTAAIEPASGTLIPAPSKPPPFTFGLGSVTLPSSFDQPGSASSAEPQTIPPALGTSPITAAQTTTFPSTTQLPSTASSFTPSGVLTPPSQQPVPSFAPPDSPQSLASLSQRSLVPAISQLSQAERKARDDKILDELARSLVLDPYGFLDQFIEFTATDMIRAAQIQVEAEQRQTRADNFRTLMLANKYGTRWRDLCWSRRLARQGKERRRRAAQNMQEKLRQSQIHQSRETTLVSELEAYRESAKSSRSSTMVNMAKDSNTVKPQASKPPLKTSTRSKSKATSTARVSSASKTSPRKHSAREGRRTQVALDAAITSHAPPKSPPQLSQMVAGSRLGLSNRHNKDFGGTASTKGIPERVDKTRSTYFKLKARGLNPNVGSLQRSTHITNERKRSRSPDTDKFVTDGKRQQLSSPIVPEPLAKNMGPSQAVAETSKPRQALIDEDEALFAAVRATRELMSESISFFHDEISKNERQSQPQSQFAEATTPASISNAPIVATSRFSTSITAAAARARLEDLNRSFASSTTSTSSSLLSSQQPRHSELPPKYRNRVSKFLPRNLYADVLMQKRRELGGGDLPHLRRTALAASSGGGTGSFRDTISRVKNANRGPRENADRPQEVTAGEEVELKHHYGTPNGVMEFEEDTEVDEDTGFESRPVHSQRQSRDSDIDFEEDSVDGYGHVNGDAPGEYDELEFDYVDEDEVEVDRDDTGDFREDGEDEEDDEDEDDDDETASEDEDEDEGTPNRWDGKAGTSAEDAIEL